MVSRRIESDSASERLIEPQPSNRPTSRSTRAAAREFSVFHVAGRRRVTVGVGRSTANRNEPQVHRALDALSPLDAVSRARLRMTVGDALARE